MQVYEIDINGIYCDFISGANIIQSREGLRETVSDYCWRYVQNISIHVGRCFNSNGKIHDPTFHGFAQIVVLWDLMRKLFDDEKYAISSWISKYKFKYKTWC